MEGQAMQVREEQGLGWLSELWLEHQMEESALSFPTKPHSQRPPVGGVLCLFHMAPLPALTHLSEHPQPLESRHYGVMFDSVISLTFFCSCL